MSVSASVSSDLILVSRDDGGGARTLRILEGAGDFAVIALRLNNRRILAHRLVPESQGVGVEVEFSSQGYRFRFRESCSFTKSRYFRIAAFCSAFRGLRNGFPFFDNRVSDLATFLGAG